MKRELLRWAFCLLVIPAMNLHAQDSRPGSGTAPGSSSPSITPQRGVAPSGSTSPAAAKPDAEQVDSTALAPMTERKAAFPDSLMKNYKVEVFGNVLKMAELAGTPYKELVTKAQSGDVDAIYQLLDFHRVVDGADALNHAVTCLELIPVTGDAVFASAAHRCSPKLRKVVLDRLMLAQVRSKKTFLRQSLTNWAPVTWSILAAQPVENTPVKSSGQKH